MNTIDIETAAGVLGLRTRIRGGKVMIVWDAVERKLWREFNPLALPENRDFIICQMKFDVTWSDDHLFRLGKGVPGVMVMGKGVFAIAALADHNTRGQALGTALIKVLLMTKERGDPSAIPSEFQTSDGGSVAVDNSALAKYYK